MNQLILPILNTQCPVYKNSSELSCGNTRTAFSIPPTASSPAKLRRGLGCAPEQLKHSLIVEQIGNTYAAASLLAFASVLDHAKDGEINFVGFLWFGSRLRRFRL